MANQWTEEQDRIAGLLARVGATSEEVKNAGEKLGIDFSAMNMRVSNFKSLQGESGLSNASKQTIRVYAGLKKLSPEDCRNILIEKL